MPVVEVPGIGDVHFPDGMPNAEMEGAIKNLLLKKGSGELDPAKPSTGILESPIRKQAAQQSFEEAKDVSGMLTRNVLVPAAQAGLALGTGGMSIPAQAAIGMGAEFGLQKAGLTPESTSNILLQGAIPKVAQLAARGVKGLGRAVANIGGKGQMAGEQAIAKRLGATEESVDRAFAPRQSSSLYKAAEAGDAIDMEQARKAISDAILEETALGSQSNAQTLRYLQGIESDLAKGNIEPKEAIARGQRLAKKAEEAFKRGRSTEGEGLKRGVEGFKESIPDLKAADLAYTREEAIDEVFRTVRKSNKVKALDDLMNDPKKGSRVRAAIKPDEMRDIRKIASQMVDIGGQGDAGIIKSAYEGTLRSFLSDPNGLTIFRHAFGPELGKMTPAGIAGLATFMRGYLALNKKDGQ